MKDDPKAEIKRLQEELNATRNELDFANQSIKKKEVELRAVIVQAEEVSHVDPLTCLFNRRQVVKDLQTEVIRAERYKTVLSISMIDIDYFKLVNDSHGHRAGDKVLIHLANILQEEIREPDIVGRYGGEEFLVLLPSTRLNEATNQAARLSKRIRETEIDIGEMLQITVSIGVAEYKHGQEDWQKFLDRADIALYDAKNNGRDQWVVSK